MICNKPHPPDRIHNDCWLLIPDQLYESQVEVWVVCIVLLSDYTLSVQANDHDFGYRTPPAGGISMAADPPCRSWVSPLCLAEPDVVRLDQDMVSPVALFDVPLRVYNSLDLSWYYMLPKCRSDLISSPELAQRYMFSTSN